MWSKAPSTPGNEISWSNRKGAKAAGPWLPAAGVASCAVQSAGKAVSAANTNPTRQSFFIVFPSSESLLRLWLEYQDRRLLLFGSRNRDIKAIDLWHPE